MIQLRNLILAKMKSPYGENLVYIDIEEGIGSMTLSLTKGREGDQLKKEWVCFMAETYRDLVTAEEISTTNPRPLRTSLDREKWQPTHSNDLPHVVYIPRKVRVGQNNEPREAYDGPKRPMKPHKIEGFRRKGNMTEKHRIALLQYEEDNEVEVLRFVPEGYTWVRPFSVPKTDEPNLKELPEFIRRRIVTDFANQFRS